MFIHLVIIKGSVSPRSHGDTELGSRGLAGEEFVGLEELLALHPDGGDGFDVADVVFLFVLADDVGELGVEGVAAGGVGRGIESVAADVPDGEGEEAGEALAAGVGELAEELQPEDGIEEDLDAEGVGEGGDAGLEEGTGEAS